MSWSSQKSGDRDPNGVVVFGGTAGKELAEKICSYLHLECAGVTLGRFPDGEMLVKKPDVIHVNRSDVDAHADFVLTAAKVSRPRNRTPRAYDGLGSAIARLRSQDVLRAPHDPFRT